MAPPGRDDPGSSAHTVPRQALAYELPPPPPRRAVSLRVRSRDRHRNATGPDLPFIGRLSLRCDFPEPVIHGIVQHGQAGQNQRANEGDSLMRFRGR